MADDLTVRIQRDTERYRKSEAVIRVLDKSGRPIEGASVKVEQLTHDFLFGCNIYTFGGYPTPEANEKYNQEFKRIFNYATLPFYWRSFEREQGKPDYGRTERMAKWCNENGVLPKGHPLVWACHDAGNPAWLPKDDAEVKGLMEARVKDIVSHYKDSIGVWDVVNESVHGSRFANMSIYDMTSQPVKWARETNPDAVLIVNEFGMFGDDKAKDASLKLLRQMKKAGIPYDAIGPVSYTHLTLPTILLV